MIIRGLRRQQLVKCALEIHIAVGGAVSARYVMGGQKQQPHDQHNVLPVQIIQMQALGAVGVPGHIRTTVFPAARMVVK